jgi:di/tricarboxylate transporter
MPVSLFLVVLLLAIIVTIIVGTKLNQNIGFMGLGFAYLLGCFLVGLSPTEIFNMWPIRVCLQIISITFFLGFITETGTIKLITDHVLYRIGHRLVLLPFVAFILGAILSFFGIMPPAIQSVLTPIFMQICVSTGASIPLMVVPISAGVIGGVVSPVGQAGLIIRSYVEAGFGAEKTAALMPRIYLNNFVVNLVIFLVGFLLLRGWKTPKISNSSAAFEKPKPATRQQRFCLIIMLVAIVLVMGLPLLARTLSIAGLTFLSSKVDIAFVYGIAGVVCSLLKLGDQREIIKNRIPWHIVMIVGGMGCLVSVARAGGAIELISSVVQGSIPNVLIGPVMALVSGLMSLCSDSIGVVIPFFLPLAPGIVSASSIGISTFCTSVASAALAAGCAPFSTGGAMAFSFIPENARKKMFIILIVMALGSMIIVALLSLIGIFG